MNVDGFSYETFYNMPINLRNYYITVIEEVSDKRKKHIQSLSKKRTK